ARLGIDHRDAAIAVAIGDEHFVGRSVEERLGDLEEMILREAVARDALPANLHHELAVLRELQDVAVHRAVAADPDVAAAVHVESVIAVRPLIAGAIAAAPMTE